MRTDLSSTIMCIASIIDNPFPSLQPAGRSIDASMRSTSRRSWPRIPFLTDANMTSPPGKTETDCWSHRHHGMMAYGMAVSHRSIAGRCRAHLEQAEQQSTRGKWQETLVRGKRRMAGYYGATLPCTRVSQINAITTTHAGRNDQTPESRFEGPAQFWWPLLNRHQ